MTARRPVREDEKILFKEAVETTRPQVIARSLAKKPPLKGKQGGLDGNTKEKLKRGALKPQASIDLHGMTETAAHRALLTFLERGQKNGLKLTLVVTGKGNPKNDEGAAWTMRERGVLKEMVPRWLKEPDFAALVSGTAAAHVRHGGGGAMYVYLRKLR